MTPLEPDRPLTPSELDATLEAQQTARDLAAWRRTACTCIEYGHGLNLTRVARTDCPVHSDAPTADDELDATAEPGMYDLRLWVDLERPWPALGRFLVEVRKLAEAHDGIEPRSIAQRRDPHGRRRRASRPS